MKDQSEPITEDEWLIRLVFHDRVTERVPIISPNAFEPRDGRNPDTDGISLYRATCLNDPTDVLRNLAEEKRPLYAIVMVPVRLITSLGLHVDPSPDEIPGHVVIRELNIADYKQGKSKFTPIKLRLAEVASENILRRPEPPSN